MKKKGRKSKNQKSENVNQWDDALMIVKQNQESITVEKKPKREFAK